MRVAPLLVPATTSPCFSDIPIPGDNPVNIAREIRSGIHIDVLIDLLTAPCYFRLLFGHARITRPFVEAVVDYALRAAGSNTGRPGHAG